MNEFEIIDRYFRRAGGTGVVAGIGDDGAVLQSPPASQLVVVADTQVDGVHFPRDMAAADIAWRAVAVNLSDIAAMGARPAWMTLALTLPEADEAWLEEFAGGLHEIAAAANVSLVGGDTTRGTELVVTVQIIGHVATGTYLARGGGRPGDRIYVSGTLGDAAAGLAAWQRGVRDGALVTRLRRPQPRLALGQLAVHIASAAIDISDGLCADLGHILRASGCGACIDSRALPLSAELLDAAGREQALQHALSGGDDYELCLAVAAGAEEEFRAAAAEAATTVTCIGRLEAQAGLRLADGDTVTPFTGAGYRHF